MHQTAAQLETTARSIPTWAKQRSIAQTHGMNLSKYLESLCSHRRRMGKLCCLMLMRHTNDTYSGARSPGVEPKDPALKYFGTSPANALTDTLNQQGPSFGAPGLSASAVTLRLSSECQFSVLFPFSLPEHSSVMSSWF